MPDFNDIEHNRVSNNFEYGILVIGISDKHLWLASGNVVAHNVITRSADADLALALPAGAERGLLLSYRLAGSPAGVPRSRSRRM